MSVAEKTVEAILKWDMLKPGDAVCVAVSGGADSVCLLHALVNLRDGMNLALAALHLNHCLRGAEADRDEAFVRALCGRLNVEFCSERADVAALSERRGMSLEEAGREARYAFFLREAENRGAKIATAHTLSDSVETALLNFARGTALRGLCGIPPVRGNIVRPLILCTRAEIEAYCAEQSLDYVCDSTNTSEVFARNRIRKHAIPTLESINAGFYETAAATLDALRVDADYLDDVAGKALAPGASAARYSRETYLAKNRAVRYRMLLRLLGGHNVPGDRARLERLDALVRQGSGAEQLSANLFFKAGRRYYEILPKTEPAPAFYIPVLLPKPGASTEFVVFSNKKLRIMHTECEYCEETIKSTQGVLKNALDYDKIVGNVLCRQKLPLDSIRLLGRGCTKTLKKLFQEGGVSPEERGGLLVLADSAGPVWVEHFGCAQRVAASATLKTVLLIDVISGGEQ